jgi:hypothetical protein
MTGTMEGEKAERIQARAAALILGVSAKTVKRLAERGEINGLKIGGIWTFDERWLRNWITDKECGDPCQTAKRNRNPKTPKISTKGTASGMSGFREKVRTYEDRYTQLMSRTRAAS